MSNAGNGLGFLQILCTAKESLAQSSCVTALEEAIVWHKLA